MSSSTKRLAEIGYWWNSNIVIFMSGGRKAYFKHTQESEWYWSENGYNVIPYYPLTHLSILLLNLTNQFRLKGSPIDYDTETGSYALRNTNKT